MEQRMHQSGSTYFHGFDYLRAFSSLAVVAWHFSILGKTDLFVKDRFLSHSPGLTDFAYFNVLLLAVPLFFLIALFLFLLKVRTSQAPVWNRITRIMYLYIFWMFLLFLWEYGFDRAANRFAAYSLHEFGVVIMTGAGSAFFFFFSLLIATLAALLISGLRTTYTCILGVVSIAVVLASHALSRDNPSYALLSSYSSPTNFLPYVFIAAIISRYHLEWRQASKSLKAYVLGALIVCSAGSAFLEWNFLCHEVNFIYDRAGLPSYSRLSVVFGASFLFLLLLPLRSSPPAVIHFMSRYSLGLFCVHWFAGRTILWVLNYSGYTVNRLFFFILVVLTSFAATFLGKRIINARVI